MKLGHQKRHTVTSIHLTERKLLLTEQGRIVVFDVYWRRAGLAEGKGGVVVAPLVLHRTLIVARVPLARLLQQGLS